MAKIKQSGFPDPWSYNPSSYWQRIQIGLVAAIAVLISIYLGLYQWRIIDHVWDPFFGEQSQNVLDSDVSHTMSSWFRIPDGVMGAWAYLGDLIFALAGSERRWQYRPWIVILFGIDVIPLGIVSAILVFMQATIVGNWCFLCLVTAFISLILVVMAYDEVWSCLLFLYRVQRKTKSWRHLWRVFWGWPSNEAYEIGNGMVKHVG